MPIKNGHGPSSAPGVAASQPGSKRSLACLFGSLPTAEAGATVITLDGTLMDHVNFHCTCRRVIDHRWSPCTREGILHELIHDGREINEELRGSGLISRTDDGTTPIHVNAVVVLWPRASRMVDTNEHFPFIVCEVICHLCGLLHCH